MKKKEMARAVAEHMREVRKDIDVDSLTAKLMKGMTQRELQILMDQHELGGH